MSFIDIEVYHNGNNQTSEVINYNREQYICSGVATLTVELIDDGTNYDPWDEVILYEEGTKKGTFYIRETIRGIGSLKIDCQDASLKLVEYFAEPLASFPYVTSARYWIERYLNEAGVNYTFLTTENGAPINVDAAFGMTSAYEIVVQMMQMSNWYMYFNPNGNCIIGSLTLNTGSPDARVDDDTILDMKFNTNDKMLRNRAIVWGGADLVYNNWIYVDLSVHTTWNYDQADQRAVVLSNNTIQTYYEANRMARQILTEFARITEEKTITVAGELDVAIGDYIFINSDFFRGGGMLTTLASEMNNGGFVTVLTLDQRCPRLFAYIGNYDDYVYIGTTASGIWRKPLDTSGWYNYSQGLTDLGITDLSINSGIFASTTSSGYLFYKTIYTNWTLYSPDASYFSTSGVSASGIVTLSGITPSGYYASCCALDKMNYTIYAAYVSNSGIINSGYVMSGGMPFGSGESWIVNIDSFGRFIRSDKVVFTVDAEVIETVTVIDMDNNGTNNILSVVSPGSAVLPVIASGDDGNFSVESRWWTSCTSLFNQANAGDEWPNTDVGGSFCKPTVRNASDFYNCISTMPSADEDFSTLTYESDNMNTGRSQVEFNQDDDFGTFFDSTKSSSNVYYDKYNWLNDGSNWYMDYDLDFEKYITGFTNGPNVKAVWIDKITNDAHFFCTSDPYFYTGVQHDLYLSSTNSYTASIVNYEYETETLTTVTTLTFNDTATTKYRNLAFAYRNGYGMYVYAVLTLEDGIWTESTKVLIFNLRQDTYSTLDWLTTVDILNETFVQYSRYPIVMTHNYFIYPFARTYDTTGGNAAWGNPYLYTFSLSTATGSYTTAELELYDDGRGFEHQLNGGKSGIGEFAGTDYVHYRPGFAVRNGYDSAFVYYMKNTTVYNGEPGYPEPYYEFYGVWCNVTPSSIEKIDQGFEFIDTTNAFVDDEVLPYWTKFFGSFFDVFSASSSIQGVNMVVMEGYQFEGRTDESAINAIFRAGTSGLTYTGYLSEPAGLTNPNVNYVASRTDDIDNTLYVGWGTLVSPTSAIIHGHNFTGSVTKDMNIVLTINPVPASRFTAYFDIVSNTIHMQSSVGRYFDYEQETGITPPVFNILKQEGSTFTVIYETEFPAKVDTSKNAPTVVYMQTQSGQPLSTIAASFSNELGTFTALNTTFPIMDVRVFDVGNTSAFVVESGAPSLDTVRYIAFVNSGGFFCIDASLSSLNILQIITPSGAMASGVMASGVTASGLIRLETTNFSPTTPYFFVASTSGFFQRNPGESSFIDYTA